MKRSWKFILIYLFLFAVLLACLALLNAILSPGANAQSSSNAPQYWRRVAGVIRPITLTDTVSIYSLSLSTPLPLSSGGTNANLTASNGGIFYSTGSAGAILSGTATANKVLMSGSSTTPSWSVPTFPNASATAGKAIISDGTNWVASTPTFPNASASAGKITISDGTNWIASTPTYPNAGTSGKVLVGDGTNIVLSTPTFPNASATSGKIIISDGTNWTASTPTFPTSATSGKVIVGNGTNYVESTPTFPNASATAGKIMASDGTNWIASTPTYPNASATAGKIIRSDGTNYAASTSTFADTYGASTILYANGANTVEGLGTGNNGVLITSGAGVPSISSTLPATVQGNITSVGTLTSLTMGGAITTSAGVTLAGSSTAATAAASTQAGIPITFTASNATPGTTNNGAAAGGSITLTGGNADRLVSGNANGGDVTLRTGVGIGTGGWGQILSYGRLFAYADSTHGGTLQIGDGSSSQNAQIVFSVAGDNSLIIKTQYNGGSTNDVIISPAGVEKLRIAQSGTVTAPGNMVALLFKTTTAEIVPTGGGSIPLFLNTAIGGAGQPTTANMDGWIKMQDSAGATVWVPVWK